MIYSRPFGVDVAFGDPLVGEPDIVTGDDILGFAGIAPPSLRLYPVVSHIAEKLHAFTMPRPRPNTRVRDLPDLALLATTGPIEWGCASPGHREDLRVPRHSCCSGRGSAAARLLGGLLRGHGRERRIGLGDSGGSDGGSGDLSRSCSRANGLWRLGAQRLGMGQGGCRMRRFIRIPLERGFSAAIEFRRVGRDTDSWSLTLVVPERELARIGEGGVLDLLDFAPSSKIRSGAQRNHLLPRSTP